MKILTNEIESRDITLRIKSSQATLIVEALIILQMTSRKSTDKHENCRNMVRILNRAIEGKSYEKLVGAKHAAKKTKPCPYCKRSARGDEALRKHLIDVHSERHIDTD